MLLSYVVVALVLLVYGIVAWLAVYALSEAWRMWARKKFRVQFRLHTFLIISAAACLTSALFGGTRATMFTADAIILIVICFPLMLGLAFFVDLLVRDLYQAFRHQRSAGMRTYRATEDQEFQMDETGEPLIPAEPPVQQQAERPRRRKHLSSAVSNPWFKMYRP